MKTHNINSDLKARTIKYLEFAWESQNKNHKKEETLIENLPESLKQKILFETNKKSFLQFPILQKNFTEETINRLSSSIKTIHFSPKEVIYCV